MKAVLLAGALIGVATFAAAQDHAGMTMHGDHMSGDHMSMDMSSAPPLHEAGQSAFAAIQEIVRQMDADPATDWPKVNIETLRQHLIDMDEVTLHAAIRAEPIPNGARYIVTGEGRTREAIRNMVLGHARTMGDAEHWTLTAQETPTGAVVIAVAKQPSDVARVRGLGLIGMMADSSHHQAHHWMLATGANPHH